MVCYRCTWKWESHQRQMGSLRFRLIYLLIFFTFEPSVCVFLFRSQIKITKKNIGQAIPLVSLWASYVASLVLVGHFIKDRTTFGIARTRTDPTFWPFFARTYLPTPTRPFCLFKQRVHEKTTKNHNFFLHLLLYRQSREILTCNMNSESSNTLEFAKKETQIS